MDLLRSLWFESRHLDVGAPRLRAELDALDPDAREEILAIGDRLAAVSLTLAQQYCRRAPAARRLGTDAFRRWVELCTALATEEPASRDAAAAYFAAAPEPFATLPEASTRLWSDLARRTLAVSRRLGELFVAGSAGILGELDDRDARLAAWVDVGIAIAEEESWEAELLALHFFESTGLALPLFAPGDFRAWAELGRVAGRLGPSRPELFTSVPRALPELLPVLRTILERTPAHLRTHAVALATRIAERFPAGVVPFYRVLPRLLEQSGIEGVERWGEEGLRVAADAGEAGLAYFALDSRTSRAVLAASSTAVAFSEVRGLIKSYLHMLTGLLLEAEAHPEVGYRPPFLLLPDAAPTTDAGGDGAARPTALFPPRVDVFATTEANLRVYRAIAAQHAARLQFGTAALDPPVPEFLARFSHPAIAEHLLAIFEGVRLDAALTRTYRGLAADLRALAAELARGAVQLPGTIEQLARVLAQGRRTDLARRLPVIAERLAAPSATVADSAQAATLVYAEIMRDETGLGLTVGAAGFPELFADDSLTDALLEFEMGDGSALGADLGAAAEGDAPPPEPLAPDQLPPLELSDEEADGPPVTPLDPQALLEMLRNARDLTIRQGHADDLDALGLYVSDLAGKLPRERMAELLGALREARGGRLGAHAGDDSGATAVYDEWDHRIGDYRHAWCRLHELPLESDTGDFFHQTLAEHANLLPEVRRQFQRIRPERYRIVHGLEDGEDFDLDAVITARADRRSGHSPSPKLYQSRQREERDVATLFLVYMSASTDEPVPDAPAGRRVIDITKEALVVMTEALEEIGDTYAIAGFSGHGRNQVEYYVVKRFAEPLTASVKGKIGAIEPKRSTRMGAALRHAVATMRTVAARSKHVILLSDGFPQDLDYGDDRRSNVYGIQDTAMAFQEAARAAVKPFCITVDKAGHDYLKDICDASRYLVIDDINALPRELPKIYQRFVRP